MFFAMRLPNIFEPGDSASDSSMRALAPGVQHLLFGFRRDVQAQQAALERAVPHRVHALGANAELEARVGRAGEDRRIPAGEIRAQHAAQLLHQRARGRRDLRGARHRADWWREIPAPSPAGCASASRPLFEADRIHRGRRAPRCRARPPAPRASASTPRSRIAGRCSRASASRFTRSQASAVVTHPSEESEVVPARTGRDIGGDHRRFDDQRARAAHGIEELRGAARISPASRRAAGCRPRDSRAAAPRRPARDSRGDADPRPTGRCDTVTFGPLACACTRTAGRSGEMSGRRAGGVAQLIADGVLEAQRAEARVRDARDVCRRSRRPACAPDRCALASRWRARRRRSCASVGALNCATTRNTRLPTRDSRQARYATASEPVNSTPSARSRTSPRRQPRSSRGQQVAEAARTRGDETVRDVLPSDPREQPHGAPPRGPQRAGSAAPHRSAALPPRSCRCARSRQRSRPTRAPSPRTALAPASSFARAPARYSRASDRKSR